MQQDNDPIIFADMSTAIIGTDSVTKAREKLESQIKTTESIFKSELNKVKESIVKLDGKFSDHQNVVNIRFNNIDEYHFELQMLSISEEISKLIDLLSFVKRYSSAFSLMWQDLLVSDFITLGMMIIEKEYQCNSNHNFDDKENNFENSIKEAYKDIKLVDIDMNSLYNYIGIKFRKHSREEWKTMKTEFHKILKIIRSKVNLKFNVDKEFLYAHYIELAKVYKKCIKEFISLQRDMLLPTYVYIDYIE